MINAATHTNFFENRATDYAKGALILVIGVMCGRIKEIKCQQKQ
jgi:hypothetical protein